MKAQIFLLLYTFTSSITPSPELVRVVRVIDADTVVVRSTSGEQQVRLLGVDAPERDQPFGTQAIDSVKQLLPTGKLVELMRSGKADLYGRTLGTVRVRLPTGTMALDSVLVARGWAWAYAPSRARLQWEAEQQRAQAYGRGLWKCGTAEPVPPYVWRKFNAKIKRLYRGGCTW